jgi:mannose-6-phosphate isomerase-like protein (cupin superfamily)
MKFKTKLISKKYDYVAKDGSECRLLLGLKNGDLAHFTLHSKTTSKAITHKSVEEIWYFIQGEGEVWRKRGQQQETAKVMPGVCITIPLGTHFQFRNTGRKPLRFIIFCTPPWPGSQEAKDVKGHWEVS